MSEIDYKELRRKLVIRNRIRSFERGVTQLKTYAGIGIGAVWAYFLIVGIMCL